MRAHTEYLWFEIDKRRDYVNITDQVEAAVAASGIQEGLVFVRTKQI